MNGSTMKIAGEDALRQNIAETKRYIEEHSGVQSFNGRSGSILPMAGDYSADQVNYDSNKTVKQVIDALATKETSDIAGQQSLVKDTVGWTGKNLLPNKVWAFSLSSGSVGSATYQANANATGFCCKVEKNKDYIISRKSSTDANKRFTVVLSENEPVTGGACQVVFATPAETEYSFNSGNYEYVFLYCGLSLTDMDIRPMLRKADIIDPTYEPYHESVEEEIEQVYVDNGVLGAKNLIPYPYLDGNSKTSNGITYTVNSDGSITISPGTATAGSRFYLFRKSEVLLSDINEVYCMANQKYILSGKGVDNNFTKIRMEFVYQKVSDDTWTIFKTDNQQGERSVIIPQNKSLYKSLGIYILIESGTTISSSINLKPMLRLASDPDDTYQPYAMTNRELMENKIDKGAIFLTSGNNLNDVTDVGLYVWRSSIPVNTPENQAWFSMLVTRNSADVTQIAYKSGTIYQRSRTGSASSYTWSNWYKFTGTAVS